MTAISERLDALRAGVKKVEDAEAAVLAFVSGIPALVQAAVDAALAAGATPEELAAFDELNARLVQEADQIAGDVVAGTDPGSPDPDPVP